MKRKVVLMIMIMILAVAGTWLMSGCKKDPVLDEPLEPIALIAPDSGTIRAFAGDTIPLEIKFTTDRPINWVKGMYDIDRTGSNGYTPSFPDTLFSVRLDTLDPRVNRYTYTGTYHVPDSLPAFSVIYFDLTFEAGKNGFVSGQNYPEGIVTGEKKFKINVR